jgi:hypothetical protein
VKPPVLKDGASRKGRCPFQIASLNPRLKRRGLQGSQPAVKMHNHRPICLELADIKITIVASPYVRTSQVPAFQFQEYPNADS